MNKTPHEIPVYVVGDRVHLLENTGKYRRLAKGTIESFADHSPELYREHQTYNIKMDDGNILTLRAEEFYYGYQFPELSWRRGSNLSTVVEHGLQLRRNGRWVIPDFQRGLVWTTEQKIRFIESLILGLPVGEYTLHRTPDYKYEVLDGQQRWDAIFCYVDGEFPVFEHYWEDLNPLTRIAFEHLSFPHRACEGYTYEQKLEAYNRMAYGGTPHEEKQ